MARTEFKAKRKLSEGNYVDGDRLESFYCNDRSFVASTSLSMYPDRIMVFEILSQSPLTDNVGGTKME